MPRTTSLKARTTQRSGAGAVDEPDPQHAADHQRESTTVSSDTTMVDQQALHEKWERVDDCRDHVSAPPRSGARAGAGREGSRSR